MYQYFYFMYDYWLIVGLVCASVDVRPTAHVSLPEISLLFLNNQYALWKDVRVGFLTAIALSRDDMHRWK